jgi:mannose-6-phosphate isomerase-like protein (cupin superfamily)
MMETAGQGKWLQTRPGERCLIRIPTAATGGAYSVTEFISSPGDSTPIHMHENEDEHFLILEGSARIHIGDQIFDAAAGQSVSLPRGVQHAWGNVSDAPLRFLGIVMPGGCEMALEIIAGGGEIDLKALAERFGIRVIAPSAF